MSGNNNIGSTVSDNWTCWTIRTNSDQSADWFQMVQDVCKLVVGVVS